MTNRLERLALQRRLRIGPRRRIILKILDEARHPLTAREVHQRAQGLHQHVSRATVRHTLDQLTAAGLLHRTLYANRKRRYEKAHGARRDALVNAATGDRIEFRSDGIEGLLEYAVRQLGYRLVDYQLQLYGLPGAAPDSHLAGAAEWLAVEILPGRKGLQESSPVSPLRRRKRH